MIMEILGILLIVCGTLAVLAYYVKKWFGWSLFGDNDFDDE
jgi:hypothetical protein